MLPHAQVIKPVDDIIEHSDTMVCPCKPTFVNFVYECICTGEPKMSLNKLITHYAMGEYDGTLPG